MPVGLFMNKIETLHSTTNPVGGVGVNNAMQTLASTDDNLEHHHHQQSEELVASNVNLSVVNAQHITDECFKYLSKFKANNEQGFVKKNESTSSLSTEENFLQLFNNTADLRNKNMQLFHKNIESNSEDYEHNLFAQNGNNNKNIKIDTILLSPMSIPIESTSSTALNTNINPNANTTSSSSSNLYINSLSNNNDMFKSNNKIDNSTNHANSSNNEDINSQHMNSKLVDCIGSPLQQQASISNYLLENNTENSNRHIDNQPNNNSIVSISNGLINHEFQSIASANNNENSNTFVNDRSMNECQINEITLTGQERRDQVLNQNSTDNYPTQKVKNNIDFAIDAVLEKCRNESSSDDEIFDKVLDSPITSAKNKKKSSKKLSHCQPESNYESMTDSASIFINLPTSSSIQTDNLLNSNNSASKSPTPQVAINQNQNQTQIQQQPMSKSSKARTSYISSLIANRQKTLHDDNPGKTQANSSEDDKQKRISQNILTILANNSQNQASKTVAQNNVKSGLVENASNFSANSTNGQVGSDSSCLLNSVPEKSDNRCSNGKKATKSRAKNNIQSCSNTASNINTSLNANTNTASQEIDFVINSFNNHATASPTMNLSNIDNSNNNDMIINQSSNQLNNILQMDSVRFVNDINTSDQQMNNNGNNINSSNDNLNINTNVTFVECSNLKRLLSQPNMELNTLNNELVNNTDSMKAILLDSFFNPVQIDVKQISNNKNSINHELNTNKNPIIINNENENNLITSHVILNTDNNNSLDKTSTFQTSKDVKIDGETNAQLVKTSLTPISEPGKAKKRKQSAKASSSSPKSAKKTKASKTQGVALNTTVVMTNKDNNVDSAQDYINIPHQNVENQPKITKAKKLKTIADIVKHNSETQRNKLLEQSTFTVPNKVQKFLSQPPPEPVQQKQQQELRLSVTNNLTLAPSALNAHQGLLDDQDQFTSNDQKNNLFTNSPLVNDSDISSMTNMNIDHLLELEFNSVNNSSVTNQQLIDKYIDLDEIDLNPLDCYRNQMTFNQTNNNLPTFTNGSNNHLDELNFQFSICSSSSSGFSEPSNFSTCSLSSQSGFNNLNNNNLIFSSESESSPTNVASTNFQYEQNNNHVNSSGLPPNYNLFQKTSNNTNVMPNTNLNNGNNKSDIVSQLRNIDNSNVKLNNSGNQNDLNWNNVEYTKNSAMISNNRVVQSNNNESMVGNGQCNVNDSMYGNFSFLGDEIKLEI